jgi:hypothetical protein
VVNFLARKTRNRAISLKEGAKRRNSLHVYPEEIAAIEPGGVVGEFEP